MTGKRIRFQEKANHHLGPPLLGSAVLIQP